VLVVDDIHWADQVLLDMLEELADRAQGPILFVCPARPELTDARPAWGGGRRSVSSVFLSPLPEAAAAELVRHLLDVDGLGDDIRSRILARAEGNPFFLEEILRQLIDEGRIARNHGRWRATEALEHVDLPDTVQGVLAARIDLLRPSEKRTLQQASVVGRIFWRGAVAALLDDDQAVDPDLRRLEERELVATRLSSSMAGEEELAFSHILTRDVAYESLPRRDRPLAHARVAHWIEQAVGDRQREYSALLAHHYAEAYRGASRDRSYPPDELEQLRRRAFDLLLLASQHATRGAAYRAAHSLAESAVGVAATPDERAAALEDLGHAYRHAALGDEAWLAYSQAVDALRGAGSTDDERIGRLSGLALETVARWAGTIRNLPPEEVARPYLDAGSPASPSGKARVASVC
jgi:predicted ATPase